jgi:hypothetical protein
MSEENKSAMEGPAWDEIRQHLERREFDTAAGDLERLLPSVTLPAERVTCLQLLASSNWLRAAEERLKGKPARAREYQAKVKLTYLAALREFPDHAGLRIATGLFVLLDESDPRGSLDYLAPVLGQDVAAVDEQKRLALRGVALAMLGEKAEAMETLLQAYGGAFPEAIADPDTGPLAILIKHKVKLPKEGVTLLIRALKKYHGTEVEYVEDLREKLAE